MIRKILMGTLMAILIALPLSVRSQPSVSIGPHIGMQKSQDSDGSNYLVGATVRARFMPAIGAEGDIGYRQEKLGNDALTIRQWPVTVTGLLYPLPFLYGGLGGGWYSTTFDYADVYNDAGYHDDTSRDFGWHLAAGVEIPASSHFKVFGDIRYVFLDQKLKDLPDAVLDGDNANFYSINVGLLFGL